MNKLLQTKITLKENNVLRINLKYEILVNNKSNTMINYNSERYSINMFLKLKGGHAEIVLDNMYYLIYEIILKQYICHIQAKQVRWKMMTIFNLASDQFLARLPLFNCQGSIDVPFSKIQKNCNFVYHLYNSQVKITPFKFSLKGVPVMPLNNLENDEKMNNLCTVFVDKIPIPRCDDKSIYFKFVRKDSSTYKVHSKAFQEIDAAYPWGFIQKLPTKEKKKKTRRRAKNTR